MPHTPGPWFLEGATVYALNEQGTNRFTALVQPGFSFQGTGQHSSRTTEEEVLANAHLFKAAPLMLAALENVIEPIGNCSDEYLKQIVLLIP